MDLFKNSMEREAQSLELPRKATTFGIWMSGFVGVLDLILCLTMILTGQYTFAMLFIGLFVWKVFLIYRGLKQRDEIVESQALFRKLAEEIECRTGQNSGTDGTSSSADSSSSSPE